MAITTKLMAFPMGSPPAPMIANGWLSKFDQRIKGDAVLYGCYINHRAVKTKLIEINSYHLLLKFKVEREIDQYCCHSLI